MSWRVQFDHGTAFVHGPKDEARRRIAACGDAGPIWVKRRDAWATSTQVGNRVLDQIEGRQSVVITDSAQPAMEFTETVPANEDARQEGLW